MWAAVTTNKERSLPKRVANFPKKGILKNRESPRWFLRLVGNPAYDRIGERIHDAVDHDHDAVDRRGKTQAVNQNLVHLVLNDLVHEPERRRTQAVNDLFEFGDAVLGGGFLRAVRVGFHWYGRACLGSGVEELVEVPLVVPAAAGKPKFLFSAADAQGEREVGGDKKHVAIGFGLVKEVDRGGTERVTLHAPALPGNGLPGDRALSRRRSEPDEDLEEKHGVGGFQGASITSHNICHV